MNFELSTEQALLKASIQKLVDKEYDFETRRRVTLSAEGWSREFWSQLAENGFLMGPFPESIGGMGFGAEETMLVMEELGRGLCLEPFLESVVASASILSEVAERECVLSLLPKLFSGESVVSLGLWEQGSRYDIRHINSRAKIEGDGYLLSGRKVLVRHGSYADAIIFSAVVNRGDGDEPSLFLVPTDNPSFNSTGYRSQDGFQYADITVEGLWVSEDQRLASGDVFYELVERAEHACIAAMAAEAVGCCEAVLNMTVDYLNQRKQFGVVLSTFQALQHRSSEMLIELEQLRSVAIYAANKVDHGSACEKVEALSQVKLIMDRSARFIAEQAIQLHGGIGVTEEYAVGHYLKRLRMNELRWGDQDTHLRRMANSSLLFEA